MVERPKVVCRSANGWCRVEGSDN